ncbi:hypothetical protein Scep_021457 [Stephania cephalantha]|uniref:Uncharacterized protein n=1 Tax=Stephania cephalantha TaxID=152367 RepID=A0AAP0F8I9_9MAGN
MFFINPELFFDYDWQPLFSDGFLQDTINLSEFLTYIALVGILNSIQQSKAIKKGNQDKLQRRRQELTQTTPDQPVDDEAVYYKVAGDCPKGCVYSLRSLWRKKRRYVDPDASTSQVLAQRGMGNFMILRYFYGCCRTMRIVVFLWILRYLKHLLYLTMFREYINLF